MARCSCTDHEQLTALLRHTVQVHERYRFSGSGPCLKGGRTMCQIKTSNPTWTASATDRVSVSGTPPANENSVPCSSPPPGARAAASGPPAVRRSRCLRRPRAASAPQTPATESSGRLPPRQGDGAAGWGARPGEGEGVGAGMMNTAHLYSMLRAQCLEGRRGVCPSRSKSQLEAPGAPTFGQKGYNELEITWRGGCHPRQERRSPLPLTGGGALYAEMRFFLRERREYYCDRFREFGISERLECSGSRRWVQPGVFALTATKRLFGVRRLVMVRWQLYEVLRS